MLRRLIFCLTLTGPLAAQQLDVDPRLFSVIAAINAAGFDTELESPNTHPLRQLTRDYSSESNPAALIAAMTLNSRGSTSSCWAASGPARLRQKIRRRSIDSPS